MKRAVILIFLLCCILRAGAQQNNSGSATNQDCSLRLRNAETEYLAGLFYRSITILEEALDSCKLSRSEKQKALELLAKSYVETGDMDKAEATVNILLKNFPHYESTDPENPEQYNRLINKFNVHPLLTIGAKNTANWLRHKTIKVYSVLPGLDYSPPLDESGYWFTYHGMAEYEFIKDLSVNVDVMFFLSNYNRYFHKDPDFNLNYWENDGFIQFPVYLKKYFHLSKNLLFYVSAGAGPFAMWKARGNVTLIYTPGDSLLTGKNTAFDNGMYNINLLSAKNRLVGQWNTGIGIGYTLKNLRLFLDARYLGGMGSFNAPEKSDLFPELKNDYFYIDNEMKMTQFEVGATISYTLFNSVKRIRK
jgi:hypothetical protein